MTENEQAVREWLAGLLRSFGVISPEAQQALALLDAKDAEYRRLATTLDGVCQAKAGVEARAEQAERERDERDAAIVEACRRANAEDEEGKYLYSPGHTVEPLRPFLPAKPDPLVEAYMEALPATAACHGRETVEHICGKLRAAIERAGGTISFEGEG